MKICKDCKTPKEENQFYGVQGECKECTKIRVQKNYNKKVLYYSEYDKNRNKKLSRIKAKRKYSKEASKRNPQKYKARYLLNSAIEDKRLFRKPCEVCGELKVEGHHSDYSEPLKVMWLCPRHHREWHKNNKLF